MPAFTLPMPLFTTTHSVSPILPSLKDIPAFSIVFVPFIASRSAATSTSIAPIMPTLTLPSLPFTASIQKCMCSLLFFIFRRLLWFNRLSKQGVFLTLY